MSLDDIQFLKSHSFKQHYTFIVDSKDRDYIDNPYPNNYTIYFTEPFKNVFGLEVIDASVPRTMYNVDKNNNTLVYYVGNVDNIETLNYRRDLCFQLFVYFFIYLTDLVFDVPLLHVLVETGVYFVFVSPLFCHLQYVLPDFIPGL